ncbi:putative aspartate/tyrosine/aromatic acid aminotransferase [Desulforapulum autotrophicum HRM2]|uniref:Aspartate/tyrosine/aromatic acid aminotransferase n=1 Tax=Desulforapulum autotrophicum (strain ATCC 43914 / DSM 3382 / VKM B-1955 / HRM2) TaxID=177437 RepID=C0QKY1_DESAH|nr:pyridoxal phosphate-dependent aminotransferase [Desulforapulum autotrophicum]ACN16221.1 putative aspartate/tyrosine/aromatic acid aminotransferase [Desulforapulum autotrophicum HRM2]
MTIAVKIEETLSKSSWIRKMFEQGAKLKAEHGAENVFDFSIGNPNLEPPVAFQEALEQVAGERGKNVHGYMPNSGYPHVRKAIADSIGDEQGAVLSADDIVITCGAAGGLNVLFKALLNPGEEVLVTRPFFVEYTFYAENHGGVLKTAAANPDFTLNLDAIERAITPKTKVMIINSPNNPTGQIYPKESLDALGGLLRKKGKEFGTVITLISDEPYRKLVFDNILVPPVFPSYENSVVVTSHAKDLSLPGERIGYLVVNPACSFRDKLIPALALTNRILGFVNAPALMQRILPLIQGASVDIDAYRKKRDMLCEILKDAGFTFTTPPGAFYIFPKSPIPDDVKFVSILQDELILAVPGTGFGGPGYFRLAFCVDDFTIESSRAAFKRAMARLEV